MAEWTVQEVEARFAEAAETAHRLPPARVQGYMNIWPILLRMAPERALPEDKVRYFPPSPIAIDRMLETMRWMLWLDEESRIVVWMRADRYEWRDVCRRIGCDRTTAWRKQKRALMVVAAYLSA
jgi:hypothetical protein